MLSKDRPLISDHNELKNLQTRLDQASSAIEELDEERKTILKKIDDRKVEMTKIIKMIDDLKKHSNTIVSEHAMLRYFERVLGFNMDEIKSKILPEEVSQQMKILGKSGVFVASTHKLKVRNGVVVTVVT